MRITKAPEVRRAELIAAARELFDKNGIENTQVSQIVKKVGVAQGLFYYYFRSKEDVVNQVIQIVMGEINEQAEEIVQSSEKSFIEKLNSYIRLYLDLIDQFSGDSEKDLHSMLDIIGQNPIAKQAHQLMVEKLKKLMRQGRQQDHIPLQYPEAMAEMTLYGLLQLSTLSLMKRAQLSVMIQQALGLPDNSIKIED